MVVRGRWRPTRRNIVPIVDSLSVVHPMSFFAPLAFPDPFRHLIYLLFLDTFVEQFVIARCRLGYVRARNRRSELGASEQREKRERMNEKRGRLGGEKRRNGRGRQNTERTASVLTQVGSYRAAQTNKLVLYLELEGANAVDDEARGIGAAWRRARGWFVEREKRRIQDKVSSLRNDTSGLYSGNASRERRHHPVGVLLFLSWCIDKSVGRPLRLS